LKLIQLDNVFKFFNAKFSTIGWIVFGLVFLLATLVITFTFVIGKKTRSHSVELPKVNNRLQEAIPFALPVENRLLFDSKQKATSNRGELDATKTFEDMKSYEITLSEKIYDSKPKVSGLTKDKKRDEGPVILMPGQENTWRKNAVQLGELPTGPQIAIVIDDAGVDKKRTASISRLMAPLTIAFLTYAENLGEQVKTAKESGHEILVHMAMEPLSKSADPGPNTLIANSSTEQILKRLRWGLSRFGGYVGINNHMGSLFTADAVGMHTVMRELKRRGLLFLDSRTSGSTVGASIALANDVPFTQRNFFLDNDPTIQGVNKQLNLMEKFAKLNGFAVAIGHPRDATITALSNWLATIAEKGFVQVPISTIVARQQGISPLNLGKSIN